MRALASPLSEAPLLAPGPRARLDAIIDGWSTDELRRWTGALDPARSHLGRTQLKRAVETALLSGARLSDAHGQAGAQPRWSVRYLVVDPGPVLAARIEARVDQMLVAGWLEEIRSLGARVGADAPAWNACGYAALREHLAGTTTLAAARERVIIATRQYAKRQRTWIRHQLPAGAVTRLDPAAPGAASRAWDWWRAGEDA